MTQSADDTIARERQRRWRLALGQPPDAEQAGAGTADELPADGGGIDGKMSADDQARDATLQHLYGKDGPGSDDDAAPRATRLMAEIEHYFPDAAAHIMRRDLVARSNIVRLVQEPGLLAQLEPDLALGAELVKLGRRTPPDSTAAVRAYIERLVDDLRRQLTFPLLQALRGAAHRSATSRRPRHARDIHWQRTIRANLKHYQPAIGTIIPERLFGFGRRGSGLRDLILCVDQSGSMANSWIHAAVIASIMASVPTVNTRLVAFSTRVADLSAQIEDPVGVLVGAQLGGGTDIDRALTYCRQLIDRPHDTTLVLISDLFEGRRRVASTLDTVDGLLDQGVQMISLLALDAGGTPRYNKKLAQALAERGVPAFACTPQQFPQLMGAALAGEPLRTVS